MSKRITLLLAVLLVPVARAADVKYFDRATNREVELRDVVIQEEGPQGLTVKLRGRPALKISALDIREFNYSSGEVKPLNYSDYRKPMGTYERALLPRTPDSDRPKLLKQALDELAELLPRAGDAPAKVRRHMAFRAAEALYRLSQFEPDRRDQAIAALDRFRKEHPGGWQVAPALTHLAQLQEDKGDQAAVQKTYEELAAVPGISDEIRHTSLLNAARTLMKTENYAQAEAKLTGLIKALPADSIHAGKAKVYLAQCQALGSDPAKAAAAEKQLRAVLASTPDVSLKALAHNTLGDYYARAMRPEDAFWEYLRVDVLYSADRYEHARALYHLHRLFREVKKDVARAEDCLERLKDKRFTGLEFQKKALQK